MVSPATLPVTFGATIGHGGHLCARILTPYFGGYQSGYRRSGYPAFDGYRTGYRLPGYQRVGLLMELNRKADLDWLRGLRLFPHGV